MTRQKTLKREVRRRMDKTGERYTAARRQVLSKADALEPAQASAGQAAAAQPALPPEFNPPVSEAALVRATGRGWEEWLTVLDGWQASSRTHTEIARWLVEEQAVDGWWAQSVTVGYERARGMRRVHQQKAGYSVGASKVVATNLEHALQALADPDQRAAWLPQVELRQRPGRAADTLRFDWPDGVSRLVIGVDGRAERKVQVWLQHEKLPDPEAAERMKAYWRERLQVLKRLLEDSPSAG